MRLITISAVLSLGASAASLQAADPAATQTPWSHEASVGFYLDAVSSNNADRSLDPAIGGAETKEAIGYRGLFKGRLRYHQGRDDVDQRLELTYGRRSEEDREWIDSVDEIVYDGQYLRSLGGPHHWYAALGAESVFTGPEPEEKPLDPLLGRASTGYAQRFEDLLPESDQLTWRVGVRVQKRWGDSLDERARDTVYGWEGRIRYQRQHYKDLSYFGQYDVFGEFEDSGHISHLGQAGLTFDLGKYVSLEFSLRFYYEARPDDVDDATDNGYDELSWRQESLVGLSYSF